MDLINLIAVCAPFVAPTTMHAIVQVESSGNPWAIGVNSGHKFKRPNDYNQAIAEAKRLKNIGANFDLGLAQINSNNLSKLGISIEQAFDPCTNVYAGATILYRNYAQASKSIGNNQAALQAAISAYNTGNFLRGFKNGYVSKVVNRALP